ncbi:FAD-binding protein [bacterium]|nr:FAD-binding protein [bacterium]
MQNAARISSVIAGSPLGGLTRRGFVAGAAVASAVAAVPAFAEEAASKTDAGSAAKDAEAGQTVPSWLGEAPDITDDDCSETVDTEVLVVGAGDSGLFAAVTAAEEGAKVLLIDRMELGFGIRASALGAVDSALQKEHDEAHIDKTAILNDIVHYADGKCDMRIWRMWADESGEAIDWYTNHAAKTGNVTVENEWNMPLGSTNYRCWPTGHASIGTDMKWSAEATMLHYFIDLLNSYDGCEHRGYTKLEKLIVEDGKVTGAYCSTGENFDSYLRVNASKGVVIATGGYVLNRDMMRALQPDVYAGLSMIFTASQPYGDGIKACLWAGAQLDGTQSSMVFDRGAVHPDVEIGDPYAGNFGVNCLRSQPFLKVNSRGERFCNESSPYDYVFHAASKFADHAWYPIWDANYLDDIDRFHTIGCSTQYLREGGDHLMGGDRDSISAEVQQSIDDGSCQQADTLEELAEKLGIDAETFVETVSRYNDLCDAGQDFDFGKEPFRLSPVREAPFYGIKVGGDILCTFSGVKITPECEAVDANGNVIEGLYVIGNDAGCKYNESYPNLAAGLNAGLSATMGRHVGKRLAAK